MHKFNRLFFLLFIQACGTATKQGPAFNEIIGYNYAENDHSLLWEISGNGLKRPSFLYGTIHITDKRVFAYSAVVAQLFDTCMAYAMELNLDDIDTASMLKAAKINKSLKQVLDSKRYARMDLLLQKKYGIGIIDIDSIKPFYLSQMLPRSSNGHEDMTQALDMEFFHKAKENKKEVIGIEKLEEQIASFDAMSMNEQADYLIKSLEEMDNSKNLYDKLLALYLEQDIVGVREIYNDPAIPGSFESGMITKRNKVMAERIDKIVQKRPTFNAIGVAHLPGKEGVIELLRGKGYTLKPVKFKFRENY
jgi:uncharacterized protein YbaP (TraB family)